MMLKYNITNRSTDYDIRDQITLPRNMQESELGSWFNLKSRFHGTQKRWLYFSGFSISAMGGDGLC
jgi:hypothetical protein